MPLPPDTAWASLSTLGRRLRAKRFTAVELTEFFLDRVERHGKRLNAVVTVSGDLALRQAAEADRELAAGHDRGSLHGIPYGAKDLLATAGIPTSWGAAPLKDQMFDEDATVVRRLREAGAVLVAKLAMVEIAGGLGYDQANASCTGPGLNPWNTTTWSGGSSSGSGSAVGAGVVPFAIGSETWGSIMTPAGYCGVTGLRPTYGRVSRHGAMALSWSLDRLGPMTRAADDAGLVLAAIAGPDPADPSASPRGYEYPPAEPLRPPFRLATLKGATEGAQPAVRENFDASIELLRPHATVEEIELPNLPFGAVAGTIIDCEMAAAFEGLVTSGDVWEMTAPEDRVGAHAALFVPAKDYINALRIRRKIQQAMDVLLAPFDAVVVPTVATVASPLDGDFATYHARWGGGVSIGGAENAAGIPAISVPNGFGERGLPTGLKFVARAFDENKLLAVAVKFQELTDWHQRRPKGCE
ncbi:MAG TPA: amidase [Pirellulales bacterium]|nr:amidase [Pirellulales bacterium]